eukprot:Partr_v1_DN28586_c0_g1_i4_m73197 putative Excision repair cross-complementing rodent repair deficiency, complementation group 1 (Includes overlapping antisense sequence)
MKKTFKIPTFDAVESARDRETEETRPAIIQPVSRVAVQSPAPDHERPIIPVSRPVAPARPSSARPAVIVSPRQRGNPLLQYIKSVPWEYNDNSKSSGAAADSRDSIPDFVVGQSTACLYLSVQYHRLHPDYIYTRMQELKTAGGQRRYQVSVLLLHVDVTDHQQAARELGKLCILQQYTLMLAWSLEECAHVLTVFKQSEGNTTAESIRERIVPSAGSGSDFMARVTDSLTSIPGINKTDVVTLMTRFGSVKAISEASREDLLECPGLGERKVQELLAALHTPFLVGVETSAGAS